MLKMSGAKVDVGIKALSTSINPDLKRKFDDNLLVAQAPEKCQKLEAKHNQVDDAADLDLLLREPVGDFIVGKGLVHSIFKQAGLK
jgi:hypothetical protein